MAFDWSSLSSKSDVFYNSLPLLNENGSLEDDYTFKFTTSPANSKYALTSSFVNGKRGLVQFKASEVYTNYHNTKLGYTINNAPGVSLTARLTDDLVPLKGSSVGLSVTSEEREERANVDFNYENSSVTTNVSLSVPLPHRVFNLKTENQEEEKYNKTVRGSVVYRVDQNKDYFVGLDGTYKLPNEGETPKYDFRTVFARKNANFEGGVYYNRVQDNERNTKCGTYVTSETDNLTVSSNFYIQTNTNQVTLDNFVSFPGANGNRYLFGVQVAPKTSVSFGVQKAIDTNTRVTFAYAYVISKEENIKRSGLRVGIELSN